MPFCGGVPLSLAQVRLHKKNEEKIGKGKGRQGEGKELGKKENRGNKRSKGSPDSTLAAGGCCPCDSLGLAKPSLYLPPLAVPFPEGRWENPTPSFPAPEA